MTMTQLMTKSRELTRYDRQESFCRATRDFARRYEQEINCGMSDADLENALKESLGIFGGCGCKDSISLCWQGAGLRIWAGWHGCNSYLEEPIFEGRETIAMAREIYQINDPDMDQLSLL